MMLEEMEELRLIEILATRLFFHVPVPKLRLRCVHTNKIADELSITQSNLSSLLF